MSFEAKNGVAVNNQFKDGSNRFREDTIYYLKETTQVDGYYKNDTTYYFVLHEVQESQNTVPSYKARERIYLFGKEDIVKVTNTKITDGFAVIKKWVNADGITTWPEGITSVTVKIQKKVGNTESHTATIMNIPATVNVPVEKTWSDFSGDDYTWIVDFVLEECEVLVSGEAASDANNDWTAVSGVNQKPISKGQTGDDITFKNLPLYRVHSNGIVYRILYSVEEG